MKCAKKLLNSFFVEVKDGGVTYKTSQNGWWYEEYADNGGKDSRVLNGMMFAVLGIHEYYEYTNDSDAKYLFDQGILSLKMSISKYDNNGHSYYDILKNPPEKYHKVHKQLDMLYNITNEEIFKEYRDKWASYIELKHYSDIQLYSEPKIYIKPTTSFITRLIQNPTKIGLEIFAINFFVLLLIVELTIFVLKRIEY